MMRLDVLSPRKLSVSAEIFARPILRRDTVDGIESSSPLLTRKFISCESVPLVNDFSVPMTCRVKNKRPVKTDARIGYTARGYEWHKYKPDAPASGSGGDWFTRWRVGLVTMCQSLPCSVYTLALPALLIQIGLRGQPLRPVKVLASRDETFALLGRVEL